MLEALCVIAAQYLPKEDIIWAQSQPFPSVCATNTATLFVEEVMRKWRALDDTIVIMK